MKKIHALVMITITMVFLMLMPYDFSSALFTLIGMVILFALMLCVLFVPPSRGK